MKVEGLIFWFRNSKRGGMATHAGVALELGIIRPQAGTKSKICMSPQMEAILIWCQCRTREYENVQISNFTTSWSDGLAFCALIHHFFPQVRFRDISYPESINIGANFRHSTGQNCHRIIGSTTLNWHFKLENDSLAFLTSYPAMTWTR